MSDEVLKFIADALGVIGVLIVVAFILSGVQSYDRDAEEMKCFRDSKSELCFKDMRTKGK